jgi:hypothetical protein
MDTKATSDAKTVEDYLKLLLAFRALPETKRSRTFMEVSGYPHYENVCSNILRFYLDPTAEHGLNDLLLSAFLKMAGVADSPPLNDVSVDTRQGTDAGNSIDLVIDSPAFTIGIENKIFHWLANDLDDYGKFIDCLGDKKPLVIKAVLGLHPVQDKAALKGGFASYTYPQFWQHVRAMLGHYISKADPKWVSYLIDLMETTTALAGQDMQLNKADQFFIENHELIEKMLAERTNFLARLNQKVATLATMMSETPEAKDLSQPPWVYAESCVVLDFLFENTYAIAFDLYLEPGGWQLQLFGRNKKSQVYLAKLMSQPALRAKTSHAQRAGDRHIVQRWPLAADLGEIRDALCSWVGTVAAAAKSAPA